MRQSQLFTRTRREAPRDEEAKNAQLLIRAGFVHKEMAGVYTYLPLGLRTLNNIVRIIREEMNAIGGQELLMTALQDKQVWMKTDRWDDAKVDNWFKTEFKSGGETGLAITHEEPLTRLMAEHIASYRDLPVYAYQFQTKFRNEKRAKSGLLRGRGFTMKDMYSFARSQQEHDEIYEKVAAAYARVYERLGIGDVTYRTYADGGIFTKRFSDEFQTISPIGEDTIYVHEGKKIAFNEEIMSDETLAKMGVSREELVEKRGVEVGNIFPLETKYSDALELFYDDEDGNQQSIIMGCYGIGISRLVGMLAEHFADDRGLAWPEEVAPFQVYLAPIGVNDQVTKAADDLYKGLTNAGVEVIYDNRDVRPGEKFADADLMGIPYRVVVSEKTLANNQYELKARTEDAAQFLDFESVIKKVAPRRTELL